MYRKLSALLTVKERRRATTLFALMLVTAFLEVVGVASILPFVSVLADPTIIQTNSYLRSAYLYSGLSVPSDFLFLLGIAVLALLVFALSFKALTFYVMTRFSYRRLHAISCRLLSAYLRQPYSFFLGRNTADLAKSVLSEVELVIKGVLLPALRLMSSAIVALALLTLLFVVEPLLSLAVAGMLGGSFAFTYMLVRNLLKRMGENRLVANQQRFILANEALNGIKELRLLGREGAYLRRFAGPSERYARDQTTNLVIGQIPNYGIQAFAFGGVLLTVLYLMNRHGLEGALPRIALYTFAAYRLLPAFHEVFHNVATLRFSAPALDALYDDLTLKEDSAISVRSESNEHANRANGSIRLENVTYYYPGADRAALENFSLEIPVGSTAAFVGTTGAGKSTIVDLILGLLEPTEGRILIRDRPLRGALVRAWQRNIGYVPQTVYLADDTVAANIAFGVPVDQVDRMALERAARAAHIHQFITDELPQGYDTVVGERGIRLSGGQRQRLVIARALYHDPDVVVFDEATSALDSATEAAVMDAINELEGRKTILLVAHRLSTVQGCRQIHVLEHGRLHSSGTFKELAEDSEPFRILVQAANR